MKKFLALMLALVMALSLAACGGSSSGGDAAVERTDTTTVAVGAVILARDDVAEADIYNFVADIFDNAEFLVSSHAKYSELSLEYGASITSVPYHPGAAKYFAEKGFEVASVKEGAGTGAPRDLRFVTGGESGTYYAFGSVIAQHATNNAGVKVVGLVVASPIMLIAAVAVKCTSKGPIIFKQERIGLHNKPFKMYKFRTMEVQKPSVEEQGWTTKDDPRVTKVGKFLRRTSIDELPQLFNILKGDMSVVGPPVSTNT